MDGCPNCGTRLVREQTPGGILFACPSCHGRMAGLAFLRHNLFSLPHLNAIWKQASTTSKLSSRQCPHCGKPMKLIMLGLNDQPVELDVCTPCQQIWFDAGEEEQLPHGTLPPPEPKPQIFPETVQERIASGDCNKENIDELDYREEDSPADGEEPQSPLKSALGFLGVPIEVDAPRVKIIPWATYSLIIILTAILALTYSNLSGYIKEWGLIPSQWSRHYGVTMVSSFFLHAGIIHLIFNLYFLHMVGDNVEQVLGKRKFFVLLGLSILCGDILYMAFNYRSSIPCVGASGGICGLIAFYAISFPQARIGMRLKHRGDWCGRWTYMPAPIAFMLFILLQLVLLALDELNRSGIAVLAHLGGMIPGIAWAIWRKVAPQVTGLKDDKVDFDPRMGSDGGDYYKF